MEFRDFYVAIFSKLKLYRDPVERAQFTNSLIEKYVNEVTSTEAAKQLVKCQKGCSACCHTQVSVNSDEAQLLATRILEDGIKIDLDKLEKQALVKNDGLVWFKLDYSDRGCVFLNEQGACRVYTDRPAVCRTNNVISDPRTCDTSDGAHHSIRLLKTDLADMVTIAAYNASQEGGVLPYMLVKTLSEMNAKKFSKSSKKNYKKYGFKKLKELFNDSMM